MADAKKFRFVSPGIFLNEIDESYLSAQPTVAGPVIIGRAEKGPGMIPVKVGTFSEFVNIFGNPIAGNGAVDDVWRDGNYTSPTYGGYAAQAYLRAGVGPVTFVRLMGTQHPAATNDTGEAGWTTTKTYNTNPIRTPLDTTNLPLAHLPLFGIWTLDLFLFYPEIQLILAATLAPKKGQQSLSSQMLLASLRFEFSVGKPRQPQQ